MISSESTQNQETKETEVRKAVREFLSGNTGSFHIIVTFVTPIINKILRSKGLLPQEKEEIKQDCLVRLVLSLPSWKQEKGPLANFLYRCFFNETLRYIWNNRDLDKEKKEHYASTLEAQDTVDDDLNIEISSRFKSFKDVYVIRRVVTAIYAGVFQKKRKQILEELYSITGVQKRKLKFLMNYTSVKLRKRLLDLECLNNE